MRVYHPSVFVVGSYLLLTFFALGCQNTWPQSTLIREPIHAAQLMPIIQSWRSLDSNHSLCIPHGASMEPLIKNGDRLLIEKSTPCTTYHPGMIVDFNRGDVPHVLHLIGNITADGKWVYMSGINNHFSDGWYSTDKIYAILDRILYLIP